MKTILYIHGMGGGADSRIPSILNQWFQAQRPDVQVIVRTYDFNPDRAAAQIDAWYTELHPDLLIGESMGANHALALYARLASQEQNTPDLSPNQAETAPPPLLLVSPALNGPMYFYHLRALTRIPSLRKLLNRWFKPREGDRQPIDFSYENMAAWPPHRSAALSAANLLPGSRPVERPEAPPIFAFFGRHDHYRRSGVVSVRQWRRLFGPSTYTLYDGSHYMEEEHLMALLIPAILQRI